MLADSPAGVVLVVTRFMVPEESPEAADDLAAGLRRLEAALASKPGHLRSHAAQALDDPRHWVMVSEWQGVGAWRRALSAYEVRIEAMPLMVYADSEPSVYETR
jgi:quinol monooxygenase YgiN